MAKQHLPSESSYQQNEVGTWIMTDNFRFCLQELIKNKDGNEVWLGYDSNLLKLMKHNSAIPEEKLIKKCLFILKFSVELSADMAQLSNERAMLECLSLQGGYRYLPMLYTAEDANQCYKMILGEDNRTYEKDPITNKAFIVLPYIPSQPLYKYAMAWAQAQRIKKTADLLPAFRKAITELTQSGIIHRDISPNNLLVDSRSEQHPELHLIDFAMAVNSNKPIDKQTINGSGTPKYAAPEVMRNQPDVDHRSDQFSLGCVFYSMLTGRVPEFAPGDDLIREFKSNVPAVIGDVLIKAISEDRAGRYDNHGDFLSALSRAFVRHQREITGALPLEKNKEAWFGHQTQLKNQLLALRERLAELQPLTRLFKGLHQAELLEQGHITTLVGLEQSEQQLSALVRDLSEQDEAAQRKLDGLGVTLEQIKRGEQTNQVSEVTPPQIALSGIKSIVSDSKQRQADAAAQQAELFAALGKRLTPLSSSDGADDKAELSQHTKLTSAIDEAQTHHEALQSAYREGSQQQSNEAQQGVIAALSTTVSHVRGLIESGNKAQQQEQKQANQQHYLSGKLSEAVEQDNITAPLITQLAAHFSEQRAQEQVTTQCINELTAFNGSEQAIPAHWQREWRQHQPRTKTKLAILIAVVIGTGYALSTTNLNVASGPKLTVSASGLFQGQQGEVEITSSEPLEQTLSFTLNGKACPQKATASNTQNNQNQNSDTSQTFQCTPEQSGKLSYQISQNNKTLQSGKLHIAKPYTFLQVSTTPSDAEVLVNGQAYTGEMLKSGTYTLSISKAGYQTQEHDIEVTKTQRRFAYTLTLNKVTPAFTTTPSDARIRLNGTDYDNQPVAQGDYQLEISKAGYQSQSTTITIKPNSEFTYTLVLNKISPTFTTTPSNATVFINNKPYPKGKALKQGHYDITIKRKGYHDKTGKIALSADNKTFSYQLSKVPVKVTPKPESTALNATVTKQGKDKVYTVDGVTFTMKHIPAGRFEMGCLSNDTDCSVDEKPAHDVSLTSFYMMETETTFALWDSCVKAGKCDKPSDKGWGRGTRPVMNVSFNNITKQFIPWLNNALKLRGQQQFSLPSESQWEYAARAGTTTKYSWGNTIDCSKAQYNGGKNSNCYFKPNGEYRGTASVKSFLPNAFGLYDMHGNVWEWTQDCWNSRYKGAPINGKAWLRGDCTRRVLRGGSWDNLPRYARSANRSIYSVGYRYYFYGFRVVQG
ncbi:SUMF1/EgtB/PvdO family nonheme iron enzyme [Psychrobium sp. nBUS_13]|uniref:SUMF1/EgtB/PvdO family nonheme iron enzyme n=1 Tax=Psychrobium sp. nBUS_13 TaxID=3395319 RepID=UPI003EBDBC71